MRITTSVIIAALSFCISSTYAQQVPYQKGTAYECTGVEIEDIDPNTLTREEKIALLENSLNNSIDRYSKCINKAQSQMAASGSAGAEAGFDAEGSGESSGEDGQGQGQGQEDNESKGHSESSTGNSSASSRTTRQDSDTGAKNQIIPPKDNDNIVCTLLWDEISSSTDKTEKEGLTKQYEDMKCGE